MGVHTALEHGVGDGSRPDWSHQWEPPMGVAHGTAVKQCGSSLQHEWRGQAHTYAPHERTNDRAPATRRGAAWLGTSPLAVCQGYCGLRCEAPRGEQRIEACRLARNSHETWSWRPKARTAQRRCLSCRSASCGRKRGIGAKLRRVNRCWICWRGTVSRFATAAKRSLFARPPADVFGRKLSRPNDNSLAHHFFLSTLPRPVLVCQHWLGL